MEKRRESFFEGRQMAEEKEKEDTEGDAEEE